MLGALSGPQPDLTEAQAQQWCCWTLRGGMDEEIFDEGTLYEEEGHGPDAEEHGEEHSQDEPLSPTHLSDEEELDMDKEEGGVAIEGTFTACRSQGLATRRRRRPGKLRVPGVAARRRK